jgi:hypothetical protein
MLETALVFPSELESAKLLSLLDRRQGVKQVTVPLTLARFPFRFAPSSKGPAFPMTISMYKIFVPIFVQFLTSASAVLDKAAAHCEAKKIEPATLLNMRLFPDMFPLVRQLRAVTDHAISGTARLAGAELITFPNNETSFAEVKERIAKTIDFVKSFKPVQIDGTEDKEIVVKFSSGERKFKGQVFLLNFCLPNFYFHATTAYDILRHCGIELGKRDFMGTPVAL